MLQYYFVELLHTVPSVEDIVVMLRCCQCAVEVTAVDITLNNCRGHSFCRNYFVEVP